MSITSHRPNTSKMARECLKNLLKDERIAKRNAERNSERNAVRNAFESTFFFASDANISLENKAISVQKLHSTTMYQQGNIGKMARNRLVECEACKKRDQTL